MQSLSVPTDVHAQRDGEAGRKVEQDHNGHGEKRVPLRGPAAYLVVSPQEAGAFRLSKRVAVCCGDEYSSKVVVVVVVSHNTKQYR